MSIARRCASWRERLTVWVLRESAVRESGWHVVATDSRPDFLVCDRVQCASVCSLRMCAFCVLHARVVDSCWCLLNCVRIGRLHQHSIICRLCHVPARELIATGHL